MVRGPLQHLSQHSPHSRHRNSCCCSDNKDEPVGLFVGTLLMAFSKFNAKFNKTITNLFKQNLSWSEAGINRRTAPSVVIFLQTTRPLLMTKPAVCPLRRRAL